jgi:hypothetical protein
MLSLSSQGVRTAIFSRRPSGAERVGSLSTLSRRRLSTFGEWSRRSRKPRSSQFCPVSLCCSEPVRQLRSIDRASSWPTAPRIDAYALNDVNDGVPHPRCPGPRRQAWRQSFCRVIRGIFHYIRVSRVRSPR